MDEELDAIIVGGGLSGLAAAYTLASEGLDVLVLERGDYSGAKNVTGGRMYVDPIREYFPDLWEKAPFERHVTHEEINLMAKERSINIAYEGQELKKQPYQSHTILRAKFDKWLAKQAERKGATVVTKTLVEDLVWDDDRVVGVVAGGDELRAKVVLACDGALSFMGQKAGLKVPLDPHDYAVGIKEVVELEPSVIEDRFNLTDEEGTARLYLGDASAGLFGGGFLYTNKESISLGLVVSIRDLGEGPQGISAPDLMERFKQRPEVACLIAGGETIEYSAHVISESGMKVIGKCYGNGILVCGDAAGFAMNIGLLVRGMDYAMGSGYLAAQAVLKARESNDYSSQSLSYYESLLKDSFILKDFESFKKAPEVLDKPYLFNDLPELGGNVMKDIFNVPSGPKDRLFTSIRKSLPMKELMAVAKNVGGFRKL